MTKLSKKRVKRRTDKIQDDERYKEVSEMPLFNEMKRTDKKVRIDSRFKDMFTDKNFAVGRANIDMRGRPLAEDERKGIKDLYDLDSDVESDDDGQIKLDLARGSGNMYSSDEDSDDTVDTEIEDSDVEKDAKEKATIWDKLTSNVKHVEWASKRLAICNMDWDNVKGEDLFLVLNSFKPVSGQLLRLSIYLSDFGAERIEAESKEGPQLKDPKKKSKVAKEGAVDE